ncbi:MAG TPA: hypothetical protein VII56_01320 [Rhizomicrobium sp.]
MSDDKCAGDGRDLSRIRQLSRGIQGHLLKAAEHTETVAGFAETAGWKLKPYLDSPVAQKIIATATSEPAKKVAIASLYQLLPLPVRWAVKPSLFETQVRKHIFREDSGVLRISDQSNVRLENDASTDS